MQEDNNRQQKKPFKVTISDEDYSKPDELDELNNQARRPQPSVPVFKSAPTAENSSAQKRKFEVHIDDEDELITFEPDDSRPENKGEIYFSGRKPVRSPEVPSTPQKSVAKKKRRRRSAVSIFFAVLIILTSGLSAFALSCLNDVLAFGRSDDSVSVTIPIDADTDQIIDILSDAGLVKQKQFCKLYCNLINKLLHKSTEYKSGVYDVDKNLGVEGYLTRFRDVQTGKDTVMVSIPEGWTIYQIAERLDKFGVCKKNKFLTSVSGALYEYDFLKDIDADAGRTFKLEGYLYPNTYEFYVDSDANSVIRKFLDEFETEWTDEYQKKADELGYTKDEILIIASIIQSEAANSSQMADISSVIHNRLRRSASWPTLNCDSTSTYITKYIKPEVTNTQAVLYASKYDTYSIQGLPPGPICNPGEDAIKAALNPNATNYYFFRHDKNGKIYLATTQAEHDANANIVLRVNNSR